MSEITVTEYGTTIRKEEGYEVHTSRNGSRSIYETSSSRLLHDPSIRELAEAHTELETYDPALFQPWVNDVARVTGFWPQTLGFVWGYEKGGAFGRPIPLTPAAEVLLAWYEKS